VHGLQDFPVSLKRQDTAVTLAMECERILKVYGSGGYEQISVALDRQFSTLHNRAQLLLTICGVLISASVVVTTGRLLMASPRFTHQRFAGGLLALAGACEIAAAATIVGGVLQIRWITQQPGDDLPTWVSTNLIYRDRKTRAYRWATILVLYSMVAFQLATSLALLHL
jgi:hypothetical protein